MLAVERGLVVEVSSGRLAPEDNSQSSRKGFWGDHGPNGIKAITDRRGSRHVDPAQSHKWPQCDIPPRQAPWNSSKKGSAAVEWECNVWIIRLFSLRRWPNCAMSGATGCSPTLSAMPAVSRAPDGILRTARATS